MKRYLTLLLFYWLMISAAFSQNSVLINLGANECSNAGRPAFSLIKNPLTTPSALATCNLSSQLPSYYNVFIAYNPKDGKLYIVDTRYNDSRIWRLDIGLPGSIACPANIPVLPDYSYSYTSNNFEFDNNGDIWSFSNYNASTGQCSMDKFDVNTGAILNTRTLQFPAGRFPTTISSGDLCILPNGRMFAVLGESPCQLYEINNYSSTSGNASATYLQTVANDCYGIAYLNGQLELTGFSNTCYYFDYNISTNTLSARKTFQAGQLPVDNTSFTPALGTTKQLVDATIVNATTADLTYEIYLQNMGNVILNNINITENLTKGFGVGNVSNVTAAFVEGANIAGLQLNPLYNGITETNLLAANQNLPNHTLNNNDYHCKIRVKCRVSNLSPNTIYLNSAVGKATINNTVDVINISDSSNNGPSTVVDPDNDGNASGIGENVPTPFSMAMLPVRFISVGATITNNKAANINWQVATPTENAAYFEVQYSSDGSNWGSIGQINISNPLQSNYSFIHSQLSTGNIYYRIKQVDKDGLTIYSKIVLLNNNTGSRQFTIYPNPAKDYVLISLPPGGQQSTTVELLDATGRRVLLQNISSQTLELNTSQLPNGTYLMKLRQGNLVETKKFLIAK